MGMATAWGKRSKRRSQREQGLSKELQVQVLRHSRWWSWERAVVGNQVTDDRPQAPAMGVGAKFYVLGDGRRMEDTRDYQLLGSPFILFHFVASLQKVT